MSKASAGDTIWVEDGVYGEHVVINSGVTLKARSIYKAIIDGQKRGTVVTMGKKSSISGFEIRNGTIGVFSKSFGCAVTQCRIVNNYETGVMSVRNCPKIEDNVIAFNGASGIQIFDARLMNGSIDHNTIAYNGNNGVSVNGTSSAAIENNIIAFNERFGVSVEDKSKELRVASNDIYGNLIGSPPRSSGKFFIRSRFCLAAGEVRISSPPPRRRKTKKGPITRTLGPGLFINTLKKGFCA